MAKRTFREESTRGHRSRLLLTVLTILEIAAGALSAVGCVLVILSKDSTVAFYGAILSAAAVTALFFGQRIAKEYPGAAVLVPVLSADVGRNLSACAGVSHATRNAIGQSVVC